MLEMDDRDEAFAYLDAFAQEAAARLRVPTECSIIVRQKHLLRYAASSAERAAHCDRVEVAAGEGPCVTAIQQLRGELVLDIQADDRWPAWRTAALDGGFRSAAALPAIVDADTTVALNLYADVLDPWERDALVGIDRFAQEVAEAIRTRGVAPLPPETPRS
ncbi:GAF domain-containing protein [Cellulomonas hominis]|uniref:GAF domain-containing protein n=1 Tax=Cellulomonas hominis TaxID=156981 RepID=UPI001C12138B|nr:GAF domain-containing protein [Cellulomonas hominis]MBU5423451.1 GAF domain-containing protein [Cellulomonas hominis]